MKTGNTLGTGPGVRIGRKAPPGVVLRHNKTVLINRYK